MEEIAVTANLTSEVIDFSMLSLFLRADLVVKSVIIILILASIYSTTIIHFINNDNFEETISLLNKQLKKVSKIPKIKERLSDYIKLASHFVKLGKKFSFSKQ